MLQTPTQALKYIKKKKKEIFKVSVTAEKQKCCISSETDERKSAEWKK